MIANDKTDERSPSATSDGGHRSLDAATSATAARQEKSAREEKLANALRQNLKRRKGQARARRAGAAVKDRSDAPDAG